MTPSMFPLVGCMSIVAAVVATMIVVVVRGVASDIRQWLRRRSDLRKVAEPPRVLPPIDTRPLKRLVNASWQAGAYDGGLTAMVEAVRVEATGEDR